MKLLFSFLRALRIVFMLLLLGLTVLLYVLLETPYGVKLINIFLPLFLPSFLSLQIDSPSGAVLDALYAKKVVYRDDVVEVEVRNGTLRLDAPYLFLKEIRINNISAEDVRVTLRDNGEPSTLTRAKLLNNLTLPFSLRVISANAKHLVVEAAGKTPWVDLQNVDFFALMNGEPHFTLSAQWLKGDLNLIPGLPLHSIDGQFSVDGKLPQYNLIFNAQVQHEQEASKGLRISGIGDFSGLNLGTVDIEQDPDFIRAPMQVTWLPHFQWLIPKLTGVIQHYPLTGHLALSTDGQHWQIADSEIKVHDAFAQLKGEYRQNAQFSFKLNIPNMQTLISGAKGHIFAEGQWTGSAEKPEIQAIFNVADVNIHDTIFLKRLQGNFLAQLLYPSAKNPYWTQFQLKSNIQAEKIHFYDHGIDSANLNFLGALDGIHPATLQSDMKNLYFNDTAIQSLNIRATNQNISQKADLTLAWDKRKLNATLSGHYQNNIWQGSLESLQTNFNIRLQKRNSLLVTENTIQMDSTCFDLNASILCTDFNWQKNKSFKASLNGKNIPINTITSFFWPEQKAKGTVSVAANLAGDGHHIQSSRLNLDLSSGEFILNSTDTPLNFPFQKSYVALTLSPQGLTTQGELNLLGQPPIRWQLLAPQLQLSNPTWMSTPIQGYLQFNTRELSLLSKIDRKLKNIKGILMANLKITGTFAKPELLGDVQFKEGQLDIPELGLHLTPIEFSATLQHQKILYAGLLNTNPGVLNLEGYTDLSSLPSKTQLKISGNTVTVMNTSEYQVTASPQLQLTLFNGLLNVEGQISIPKAKISPIDLGDTVTLSNDVVFVNGREKKKKTSLPIQTRVKIVLGDAIYLKVKGMTARLTGIVDVTENANSDQATGIGQINIIDGRFKGHGQDLTLRTGRALFTGSPVTNPGLYIEAVRMVSTYRTGTTNSTGQNGAPVAAALQTNVLVGARITGTVETPQVSFFSEPSGLTQSQILSYLVLGKAQSSGSSLDTSLLLQAISFLDIGSSQTTATQNTLQKNLGLDVDVESQQEYSAETQSLVNNTSLVLGKALSPKLFVDYSIGLIEPINILHITYKLSEHFTLRSESNVNAQGLDLFYNIER